MVSPRCRRDSDPSKSPPSPPNPEQLNSDQEVGASIRGKWVSPAATKDLNEPCFSPAWPPSEPDAVRRASCQRPRPGPPPRSDPIRHDPRKCPLHPAINITTTRRCLIHHIESPPPESSLSRKFSCHRGGKLFPLRLKPLIGVQ